MTAKETTASEESSLNSILSRSVPTKQEKSITDADWAKVVPFYIFTLKVVVLKILLGDVP